MKLRKLTAYGLMLYLTVVSDVYGQCVGCTWIEVSPTGKTLICTMLRTGEAYCEVQAP